MGKYNAMFKHIAGYVNEVFVLEPQEPGGQAGQADHDKGHRNKLRPRLFDTRQDTGNEKEEEEGHGANGADQWIQRHDLFGNRNNGFGNGFDGGDDDPEKGRDLFDDDQHADRHQHAFDHRDGKKQREPPGVEDAEDHLDDPDERNGHQQERIAHGQITIPQRDHTG